jgi:BirA family transcriptional regulator, biotin operon repressor / biotin---[acetyl-CoA-carboxylase] ligase
MQKRFKPLLQILRDGNYHSGTALGHQLGLTRGAIWEILKQFKEYGIAIEAKTNLGYRIPHGLELLDKNSIAKYSKNTCGFDASKILVFDELASTNSYLEELIKAGKPGKYACFAEHQTAGRGRLGRTWISPFAQNIYLSLSWQFSREPHELSGLGLAVAVATIDALKKYGIKNDLSLKWPNDILWEKRKLAGILIDLFGETHHVYNTVIGIGLNVNMTEKTSKKIGQPWCDIAQITNAIPQRNKLAGLLLTSLLTTLTTYQKHGLKPFIKKWQKLDATYGKKITLITPQQKIAGTGFGINEKGYFLLKDSNNQIRSFAAGEISLRF